MAKSALFLLGIGLQLVLGNASYASLLDDPAVAGAGGGSINKAKTDFEVLVTSDTVVVIDGSKLTVGGTSVGAGVVTNNASMAVTITWNTPIPANTLVLYSFTGQEATFKNKISWTAKFTPAASPTDLPSLGWDVTPSGDVSLTNAYPTSISFSGLVFQQPASLTVDSMLALLAGPAPRTPATISAGVVPANSELLVGNVVLPPGGYLTGDYSSSFVDSSFSPLTTTGGLGHQSTAPEPSTAILIVFALGAGEWWRRTYHRRGFTSH
jgi:hypothetical protein